MMEYTYKNNRIEFVAIIDHKHGTSKSLSLQWSPMQAQLSLAEKLGIPFFVAVDYLEPDQWAIPAYYVIPANSLARIHLSGSDASPGVWHTVRAFSKLMHHLRGITWNGYEAVPENAYGAKTLANLPDESVIYPLPNITNF